MTYRGSISRRSAFGACLSLALVAGPSVAQDASDAEQIRKLGKCRGCSFAGLNVSERVLYGLDLKDSTLRGVAFDGADLSLAIFANAVLENVSFAGADLSGANFAQTRLVNVTFLGADLRAAVFEGAILEETDLSAGRLCNTQMPDDSTDNSGCN